MVLANMMERAHESHAQVVDWQLMDELFKQAVMDAWFLPGIDAMVTQGVTQCGVCTSRVL